MNPAQVLGALVVAGAAYLLARAALLRRRARREGRPAWYVPRALADHRRLALVVLILSVLLFLDCTLCRLTDGRWSFLVSTEQLFLSGAPRTLFTESLWLALYTVPVFFLGTFLAAAISAAVARGRFRTPRTMLGAAVWGAVLPLCSCAAAPVARSLATGGRQRAALVFLVVAPALSPIVIVMSWGVLGWQYTVARIVATVGLAFAVAPALAWLAVPSSSVDSGVISSPGCGQACAQGCSGRSSVLLDGWRMAWQLHPLVVLGILLGGLVSASLPEEYVLRAATSSWGLPAVVALGLPLYICTGEEIPLLQPLLDMGLPLGHALAFTLTGNILCVSSYLLIASLFGRRVALGLAAAVVLGSLAIGAAVNALLGL